MSIEIIFEQPAESIFEGTLVAWYKSEGDAVKQGELVGEIETDKAVVEITSPTKGIIKSINKKEGDHLNIGDLLCTLKISSKNNISSSEEDDGKSEKTEILMHKEETTEINSADKDKTVEKVEVVEPVFQSNIVKVSDKQNDDTAAQPAIDDKSDVEENVAEQELKITAVARNYAKSHNINLDAIAEQTDTKQIRKSDVVKFKTESETSFSEKEKPLLPKTTKPEIEKKPTSEQVVTPSTDVAKFKNVGEKVTPAKSSLTPPTEYKEQAATISNPEKSTLQSIENLPRRRITMMQKMVEVQKTAVMATTFNEIDTTEMTKIRKRYKKVLAEQNKKLGMTSFFVKAVVHALKKYEVLNATLDGDKLIRKYYYNIGIAVASEAGLVVPVIKNVENKTFLEIEQEVAELATKAREKRLRINDLIDGTFTITNGGIFGSLFSTPLINPPQLGILGLHNIQERPIVVNHEIVIKPMMYVALTYDHRIVEGSDAVRFLKKIKEIIEDPPQLLIGAF